MTICEHWSRFVSSGGEPEYRRVAHVALFASD
jgi:hypothetical protein